MHVLLPVFAYLPVFALVIKAVGGRVPEPSAVGGVIHIHRLHVLQIIKDLLGGCFNLRACIGILHVAHRLVDLMVRRKVGPVYEGLGDVVVDVLAKCN